MNQKFNSITIYPNPARNEVTIDGIENNTKIIISDVYGREIVKTFLIENKVHFSELETGIYYFTIYLASEKIVKKIVVE
jgi:hypothetical protein